jgi:AcrR family transcriptional regulator
MQKQTGFSSGRGVLDPSLPLDIGARSQRERIVQAMIDICAEKTFAGTTIADIVGGAAISRTTFYKHFDDKRACFDAALESCIEEMRATAAAARASADSQSEVRKVTQALLELLADNPALAQIALGEAAAVDARNAARYRDLVVPVLEAHCGRIQLLILDQLAAGRVKQLPELLPEITYIATLPFAGHEEALRQARQIASGEAFEETRATSTR